MVYPSHSDYDKAVLHILLDNQWLWSVEEIVREVGGDRIGVGDAVARLAGAGLVHRIGEFVFPTRTARRADEIENS